MNDQQQVLAAVLVCTAAVVLALSVAFWLICSGLSKLEERRVGRHQYPAPNRAQRRARARS